MNEQKPQLSGIGYVKLVTVGSINPNNPLSEESRQTQVNLLNKCLNEFPKGKIIGRDITIGSYQMGEHSFVMERITYHIGFERKPVWEHEN